LSRIVPTQVPNIKVCQVSAGFIHTLVIDVKYNVLVCGRDEHGALGLGNKITEVNRFTQIPVLKALQVSAGKFHSLIHGTNNII